MSSTSEPQATSSTPQPSSSSPTHLTLFSIVRAFNSPINEEQAWAICYQLARFALTEGAAQPTPLSQPNTSPPPDDVDESQLTYLPNIDSLEDIIILKDGSAKVTFLFEDNMPSSQHPVPKFLSSLGSAIFQALDYGLSEHEERSLEPSLEELIECLISALHNQPPPSSHRDKDSTTADSCDEGIEGDSGDPPSLPSTTITLKSVMDACTARLSRSPSLLLSTLSPTKSYPPSTTNIRSQADSHYRAVCRALVVEAEELIAFLTQVSRGTRQLKKAKKGNQNDQDDDDEEEDRENILNILDRGRLKPVGQRRLKDLPFDPSDLSSPLDVLESTDWARLWMQVIRELRDGVKLKKVEERHLPPIQDEYELTPYEMLLNDIRGQRYKLRHVTPNSDILHRVKKDAHELILEFIRSRPPLVPVSKRKMPAKRPLEQEETLYEKLMSSIRQEHKLRPTPQTVRSSGIGLGRVISTESGNRKLPATCGSADVTPAPRRRLIKADLNLRLTGSDEEEDDPFGGRTSMATSFSRCKSESTVFGTSTEASSTNTSRSSSPDSSPSSSPKTVRPIPAPRTSKAKKEGESSHPPSQQTAKQINVKTAEEKDKDVRTSFSRLKNLARLLTFDSSTERRHSITICDSSSTGSKTPSSAKVRGSKSSKGGEDNNNYREEDVELIVDPNEDTRDRIANIWAATDWGRTYDCLSLTLEEVQHIRSVLTRAELESLGVTRSLRDDLEKGRICFTCLKTKFSLFNWRILCQLCERSICDRCATTMHVPTLDSLAKVPVYMLSPTPTPSPPGDEHDPMYFPKFPHINVLEGQQPSTSKETTTGSRFLRAFTSTVMPEGQEKDIKDISSPEGSSKGHKKVPSGPRMKLCRDCKLLVRHLIDVGHTNYDSENAMTASQRLRTTSMVTS